MISRLSGLVRTMVVASFFGAGPLLDAFLVAFRIPNLLREMLAEGALANSFTRVYSSAANDSSQSASKLFIDVFKIVFCFSILLVVFGIFYAPVLVEIMTSEQAVSEDFLKNATGLTRVLLPFLSFMMFGSIFSGVLHYQGRFFLSAISSLGFNIGFILGAILFAPVLAEYAPLWVEESIANKSVLGLAIGVLLGGFFQTVVYGRKIYGSLIRPAIKNLLSIRRNPFNKGTLSVFTLMLPASLAASTGVINQIINTNFATGLESGTVSWLDYSFRILQLPIGVFGVSVGIAILPKLSTMVVSTTKDFDKKTSEFFVDALILVLSLLMPCWAGLYFFNEDIVRLLYAYGKFSDIDVSKTSEILFYSSFGLVFYGLNKTLIGYYYTTSRTVYAMYSAVICVLINYGANTILVPQYQHIGLAMTTAIVLFANSLLLVIGLARNVRWPVSILVEKLSIIAVKTTITLGSFYLIELVFASVELSIHNKLTIITKLFCAGIVVLAVFYRSDLKQFKNIRR